jgi:RHS repeat-associated protein
MLDRTAFIHMNGRVFDPRLGRFVQVDPIVSKPDVAQGHNRYGYVSGNSLSMGDPTGLMEGGCGRCGTIVLDGSGVLGHGSIDGIYNVGVVNSGYGSLMNDSDVELLGPEDGVRVTELRVDPVNYHLVTTWQAPNPNAYGVVGIGSLGESMSPTGDGPGAIAVGTSVAGYAAQATGTASDVRAKWLVDDGRWWVSKSNKWYRIEAAPGKSRPFYGNQSTNSRSAILNSARHARIIGRASFPIGTTIAVAQYALGDTNGAFLANDLAFSTIAVLGGPVGWTFGALYFSARAYYDFRG